MAALTEGEELGRGEIFLGWVRRGFQHGPMRLKRWVASPAHTAIAHPAKWLLDWENEFGARCDNVG